MPRLKKNDELIVEHVLIDSISLDPVNARKHPERNIEAIKGSLRRFGQRKPIVVDKKGVIRAGNGTWLAAKALEWKTIAIVRTDLQGVEATAFSIADNRSGELALWEDDILAELLKDMDEDLQLVTGFDEDELAEYLSPDPEELQDPEPQIEKADELQEKWGTELGQLWEVVGKQKHRSLCDDVTHKESIEKLLGKQRAQAMLTDPPYGMGEKRIRDGCDSSKPNKAGEWDKETFDIRLLPVKQYKTLIWGAQYYGGAPKELGLMTWSCWDKLTRDMGSVPHGALELCCANFGKSQVWPIMWGPYQSVRQGIAHPTAKPVELIAATIEMATGAGDTVFDPFLGSGTTMVAAEQLNRKCYGIEIEPKYVAVTLERMSELGCKCKLVKGG